MAKVAVVTLGCPKNQVDSEIIKGLLCENGYKEEAEPSLADIIVVNTCGFIEDAKQESIDTLFQMIEYKKKGNCRLLVATGCLSQRYGKELMKEIPEIDVMLGTTSFPDIVKSINHSLQGKRELKIQSPDIGISEGMPRRRGEILHYGYLRIAEGCDNHCSYCIIPKLRGGYRSRREEDIVDEAGFLVSGNAKEIILIAQDTTGYGRDLYGERRLPLLLSRLCGIEKLEWLRLLYCYPEGITKELLDTIKQQDKICNYLDIPIQHVSDKVLKLMNRRTSALEMERLLAQAKEHIPQLVLRSTIIVGFPGESREDFEKVLALVRKGYFDRLGVFTYSREEDTPAFNMKNQVSSQLAAERKEILMLEQQKISLRKNHSKVGREFRVIVDGQDNNLYCGRTYGDAPDIDNTVLFTSDARLNKGDFVMVRMEHGLEYDLIGSVVE